MELNNIEHTVIVPKRDNSLRPIEEDEIKDVAKKMSNRFGGVTVNPNQVGCWFNKMNKLQCEENVEISSVGSANNEKERKSDMQFMDNLGEELGKRFGQQEIMQFEDKVKLDFVPGEHKDKLGDELIGKKVFERNMN